MSFTVVSALNVPIELRGVFDVVMTRGIPALGARSARLLRRNAESYLLVAEFGSRTEADEFCREPVLDHITGDDERIEGLRRRVTSDSRVSEFVCAVEWPASQPALPAWLAEVARPEHLRALSVEA